MDSCAFPDIRIRLIKSPYYLKACSASFSQSTVCLLPDLHPELLSEGVEGQQLQWLII